MAPKTVYIVKHQSGKLIAEGDLVTDNTGKTATFRFVSGYLGGSPKMFVEYEGVSYGREMYPQVFQCIILQGTVDDDKL